MHPDRRRSLRTLLALSFGLAWPFRGGAAAGSGAGRREPFEQALASALGDAPWVESDRIRIEVPELAENGAIVPITVASSLPATRRILIFAARNPGPLLAEFHFEESAEPWVSLRLKLNESGPVLAIAESGGRYYGHRQYVKVMVGGCS